MKLLAIAALAALFAFPAFAQQNCAPRDLVVERLASEYGESPQMMGIDQRGSIFEVFASLDTGTWTVVITTPSGQACFVAAGEAFAMMRSAPDLGEDS